MSLRERLPSIAAALSAVATLACCLPLGVAGAVGALGLSVALEAFRPWLIGLAVVLLAFSGFQMFPGGRNCRRRSRLSLVLFGVSAVLVLGVMLFPQTLANLIALTTSGRPPAGQPPLVELTSPALAALQAEFNRASSSPRVILLLSPT